MWKLVIADDEPKIRRGLENILDWSNYDIEIVGEAEDGEIALEVIKEKNPDIILLDINMPFINGLNLLQKLKDLNNNSIVIIISGYDDFAYAKKALQLNVFDYVLKPVNKKDFEKIITEAISKLNQIQKENDYLGWVKKQLAENMDALKKTFFSEWLNNRLSDDEVLREMKFFNIEFSDTVGIIMVRLIDKLNIQAIDKKWNIELLEFAISNLLNDEFIDSKIKFIFTDDKKNIILVAKINDISEWISVGSKLEIEISKYIKCNIIVEQANISGGILKLKDIYLNMMKNVNEKKQCSPMVLLIIKYIEENYYLNDLNINGISDKLEVTPSYLSKLLKKETGMSFIEYLTNLRIKKAKYMMEDPTIKIYNVAELVGYSNQHYFCRAFKRVVGFSPTEYKRGK